MIHSDSIKRTKAAAAYIGVSLSTLKNLRKREEFPPPIRLSTNAIGWKTEDLDAWLEIRRGQK